MSNPISVTMPNSIEPEIHTVFEPNTSTWQYIVADPVTKNAVIIDSVLDYDPSTGSTSTIAADNLLNIVKENSYNIVYILETHVHADHLTAANYIQQTLQKTQEVRPQICIGKRIEQVQNTFASKYNVDKSELSGVFDKLLDDGERLPLGKLEIQVLHLPGHTPDHLGYVIGSNVFTGDSVFLPDVGSARCDFPGGDATALFQSMKTLLSLPEHFRLYSGHDYPPKGEEGRTEPKPFATVQEHRKENKHVRDGVVMDEFVQWRKQRDATLGEPRLLHQSLKFNIGAGKVKL